jgi:tetratricopeptide (TPR) repeat protein
VSLGTPNACNQCHADRDAQWAAAEIRRRYPDPKPGFQGFAEAFAAADRGDASATIALAQVAANQDESAIARASALARLGRLPSETSLLAAEAALDDPSPLVRRAAIDVYELVPPGQRLAVVPLLSDPSRIVRMQAAHTLAPVPEQALDTAARAAFAAAAGEYVAAERFNADRPEHRTNLGGFHAARGDAMSSEAEYRAALALDARYVPAWTNLADLMRMLGREAAAESVLREGLEENPRAAALHHALGLTYVRQGRKAEALAELRRATELDPSNERFKYVYDVARQELQ